MSPPIANETWRSFIRSRYRKRLLLLLSSLGEAYVGQLARGLGISHARVLALLEGDPEAGYARELALVELGLAQPRRTPAKRGRAYEITTKGRRKARSVAAARARRAQAQPREAEAVAERTAGEGTSERRAEGTGDGTSVTWSVRA